MKHAYSTLVIFPLSLVTWIGVFWFQFVPYVSIVAGLIGVAGLLTVLLTVLHILHRVLRFALASLGISTAMFDMLADRPRAVIAIIYLMISLGISIAAIVLYFALVSVNYAGAVYFYGLTLFVLAIALASTPIVVTVLVSRIRYPYQHIVVGVLALWVVVMMGGVIRYTMIGDGLDAFAGEERREAESVLSAARKAAVGCYGFISPEGAVPSLKRTRVVKDDNDSFDVKYYTWWGIPTDSKCYRPG